MTTKDRVLETALPLFLDHGYHGTSIKLIVDTSGVSTGSVYHHFSNKEDIIKELYNSVKSHMNENILMHVDYNIGIRQVLHDYWNSRIRYSNENPQKARFIRTFFNSKLIHNEKTELINAMYDDFSACIHSAMDRHDIIIMDTTFFYYDLFNACDAVTQYIETEQPNDFSALSRLAFKKYWRSIVRLDIY